MCMARATTESLLLHHRAAMRERSESECGHGGSEQRHRGRVHRRREVQRRRVVGDQQCDPREQGSGGQGSDQKGQQGQGQNDQKNQDKKEDGQIQQFVVLLLNVSAIRILS